MLQNLMHFRIAILPRRGMFVLLALLAVAGCDVDPPFFAPNCNRTSLPPMTVDTALASSKFPRCGSISIYGYLRLDSDGSDSGSGKFRLVSNEMLLSKGIGEGTLRYIAVLLDFSESEFPLLPLACVNQYVVADGDFRMDGSSRVVLNMDDTAAVTVVGGDQRRACR